MFALLRAEAIQNEFAGLSKMALDSGFRNDVIESAAHTSTRQNIRQSAAVLPKDYPILVTFGDVADPMSVNLASLAASFGAGYRAKGITVQTTDENVLGLTVPFIQYCLSAYVMVAGMGCIKMS